MEVRHIAPIWSINCEKVIYLLSLYLAKVNAIYVYLFAIYEADCSVCISLVAIIILAIWAVIEIMWLLANL